MNRVMLDPVVCSQLGGFGAPVEVVDPEGRCVGHFLPGPNALAAYDCPYSPEELEQMRAERGGRSLDEIWKSIGAK